jgi:hypothetical protein
MFPARLRDRLDGLIDDLIVDGGFEAASLASILMAAKDSVKCDYHVALSRWVWAGVNEMKDGDAQLDPAASSPFEPTATRSR